MKKYDTKKFIELARNVHGDKYDYSKCEYVHSQSKVCIICPEHGEFWQMPQDHLKGNGCPMCYNERRGKTTKLNIEKFIERAKKVHGNKYDYSKVVYKNIMEKVCIICPEHGEFWQTPNSHINNGDKCPKCAHRSYKKTTEEFIEEAKTIHGDKYDYTKVKYVREDDKVCIICQEHGEFWQTPHQHLAGRKCPKCANEQNGVRKRLPLETFIKRANEIHKGKYDYSKSEYKTTDTPLCIICPIHGEFWQAPHNHIGQKQGCPKCSKSHMEIEISEFLDKNEINYEEQKKFEWLRHKKKLSLDFYLPDYNVAIECQGEQHFTKFRFMGDSDEKLQERFFRDRIKKDLCEEHGIKIIYYSNCCIKDGICNDKNKLLEEIKKCAV